MTSVTTSRFLAVLALAVVTAPNGAAQQLPRWENDQPPGRLLPGREVAARANQPPRPAENAPFRRVIGLRCSHTYMPRDEWAHLAFSSDGRFLAVGGSLFSVEHLLQLGPVLRSKTITRLALNPVGNQVLGLDENIPRYWDVSDKAPAPGSVFPHIQAGGPPATNPSYHVIDFKVQRANVGRIIGPYISPDGKHLLILGSEKVGMWSLPAGEREPSASLPPGSSFDRIYPLGKSGRYLLWSPQPRDALQIWDGTGFALDAMKEPESPLKAKGLSRYGRLPLAVSPDGKTALDVVVFYGTKQKWIYVWDLTRSEVANQLSSGYEDASAIAYLGDGSGYVVGYHNRRIEIRDLNHKVIEVVTPAVETPNGSPAHDGPREIASSPDGTTIAVYHSWGEVVLYRRGGMPVRPKPTVAEFTPLPGTRWVYDSNPRPQQGEWVIEVGSVEVIGTDQCLRLDRFIRVNKSVWSQAESHFVAYRPEGLVWVGVSAPDRQYTEFLDPPVILLPADRTKGQFPARSSGADFRIRVREGLNVDTPFRAKVAAVRVDREKQVDRQIDSDSIWFAKDLGIVMWQIASRDLTVGLELKAYEPGKE